ncbi:unnamed protein product [marine sediment metagenome]|uniref:HEAT repeat domain-containing protein n=1 Tax=marine sediment metagenome TaxID=412755 RepID=X1KB63_9ZZZZ
MAHGVSSNTRLTGGIPVASAIALAGALLACLACVGCDGRPPSGSLYVRLQDDDPTVRIGAIMESAEKRDDKAMPYLVDRLDDSESDVRFFAYLALKELAGDVCDSMQWRYYDPPAKRAEALKRWRAWLRQRARRSRRSSRTQPAAVGPHDPNAPTAPRGTRKAAP